MLANINQIQNPVDYSFEYDQNHLVQALANLGQRIGLKGNGIKISSFTFKDIINKNVYYDPDKCVGALYYTQETQDQKPYLKANFAIYNIEDQSYKTINNYLFNIYNNLSFNSNFYLSKIVNNIQYLLPGSVMYNDGEVFSVLLKCSYQNSNNHCYIYNRWLLDSNVLDFSYHLKYDGTDYGTDNQPLVNHYSLSQFKPAYDIHDNIKGYDLTVYLYSISANEDNLKQYFVYDDSKNDEIPNNDNLLRNVKVVRSEEEFLNYEMIYKIINDTTHTDIYKFSDITYQSNYKENDTNPFIAGNNVIIKDINNDITVSDASSIGIDINNILQIISIEQLRLYYELLEAYDVNYYAGSKDNIYKYILCKIYEELTADYIDKYSSDDNLLKLNCLYIPLTYEFNYFCNDTNELIVYYSNDIYIEYAHLSLNNYIKYLQSNHIIFNTKNEESKTKIYSFLVNYNHEYDGIINNIRVKYIYTLPYINYANNWQINDEDSNISAIGKNAGNPNVIILYYENDKVNEDGENYPIILTNNEHNDIIFREYELTQFKVNSSTYEAIKMPVITEENIEYLKDAVIFAFTSNHYSSIWTLSTNETTNQSKMSYIVDPILDNNIALKLSIFDHIINEDDDDTYSSNDSIILKAINNTVAQTDRNGRFVSIRNKSSYDNIGYNNPFNLYIEYDNYVKKVNGQYVASNNGNNKYIESIDAVQTTSSLYKTPNTKTVKKTIQGQSIVTEISNIVRFKQISNIYINGQEFNSIDELSAYIDSQETYSVITEDQDVYIEIYDENNTSTYKEYIPNFIIPTIDLSEVLLRNNNVINRVNILGFTKDGGKIYNGYIGTSFNNNDEGTLHISGSETNINVGTNTLFKPSETTKFTKYNKLSLDFDTIALNANTIITKGPLTDNVQIFDTKVYYKTIPLMLEYVDKTDNDNIVVSKFLEVYGLPLLYINKAHLLLYDDIMSFKMYIWEVVNNTVSGPAQSALVINLNNVIEHYLNYTTSNYSINTNIPVFTNGDNNMTYGVIRLTDDNNSLEELENIMNNPIDINSENDQKALITNITLNVTCWEDNGNNKINIQFPYDYVVNTNCEIYNGNDSTFFSNLNLE